MWTTRLLFAAAVVAGLLGARACARWATSPSPANSGTAASHHGASISGTERPSIHARGGNIEDHGSEPGDPGELDRGEAQPGSPSPSFHASDALRYFAPRPGEDLLSYRDRVLPIAQAVVAPQRARARRLRESFYDEANLSADQRQQLDAITDRAANQISDRVLQGLLSGDLLPPRVRPMTGVLFAKDLLDIVASSYGEFESSLTPDQQAVMAGSAFDFADNLLFSARWEDLLGISPPEDGG